MYADDKTKAFYITFDGSVRYVENETQSGPGANNIKVVTPNGGTINLGSDKSWGDWNNL